MSEEQQATDGNDSDSSNDSADRPGGEPGGITDEQLPEDLQPHEENPLARHPGQTGDDADRIGADTEGGDAENPSTDQTYGSGPDDGFRGDSDNAEVKAEEDDGSAALDNGGGGAG